MAEFLWGALTMTSMIAAVLFARSWRLSGDRLFLYFALAFVALALNWIALAATDLASESRPYVYLFRLLAFILIAVGILEKNRRQP